jgi:hypothetical protein
MLIIVAPFFSRMSRVISSQEGESSFRRLHFLDSLEKMNRAADEGGTAHLPKQNQIAF